MDSYFNPETMSPISIRTGESSKIPQKENTWLDTMSVVFKLDKTENAFGFNFTYDASISDHYFNDKLVFNEKAKFKRVQGRTTTTMAVFQDGKYISYPGEVGKDSDGRWQATIVNGLVDENIQIQFSCVEGDSFCGNDGGIFDLGFCDDRDFDTYDGDQVLPTRPDNDVLIPFPDGHFIEINFLEMFL